MKWRKYFECLVLEKLGCGKKLILNFRNPYIALDHLPYLLFNCQNKSSSKQFSLVSWILPTNSLSIPIIYYELNLKFRTLWPSKLNSYYFISSQALTCGFIMEILISDSMWYSRTQQGQTMINSFALNKCWSHILNFS